MGRLRNTIEQCLTSFKHTVRSHNKLQQVVQLDAPSGHGQFLYAVCSSILKSSRLQKTTLTAFARPFVVTWFEVCFKTSIYATKLQCMLSYATRGKQKEVLQSCLSRARMWPMKWSKSCRIWRHYCKIMLMIRLCGSSFIRDHGIGQKDNDSELVAGSQGTLQEPS